MDYNSVHDFVLEDSEKSKDHVGKNSSSRPTNKKTYDWSVFCSISVVFPIIYLVQSLKSVSSISFHVVKMLYFVVL